MRWLRSTRRVAAAAILVGVPAYAVVNNDEMTVPTRVAGAVVEVGVDTARVVERVTYRVPVERVGDVLLVDGRPAQELVDAEVATAWAAVTEVWPADERDRLLQLSVIRESPRGLVGVVHLGSSGGWILSLDAADLADEVLIAETIVHELAHAVTLESPDFTFGDGECAGVRIELGCAHAGSALARFARSFWPDGEPLDGAEDAFVTEYARSAVHEDFAETFTGWVFDWPSAERADVGPKVDLLASDPALASLREELSARVSG